ncbi:MAG: hypothetical protein EU539_00880 [Promethearchaeota archaeon]|nr:MAG: hypothetical protein EU539_00880 [Candidatus Lokiarchaeota archaeon]
MAEEKIDVEDIESFIDGLKKSFDSLEQVSSHQGFQMQLAKAISTLRLKKVAKQKLLPKFEKSVDLKDYLLERLEELKVIVESDEIVTSRKFRIVMEIAKLREKLTEL